MHATCLCFFFGRCRHAKPGQLGLQNCLSVANPESNDNKLIDAHRVITAIETAGHMHFSSHQVFVNGPVLVESTVSAASMTFYYNSSPRFTGE